MKPTTFAILILSIATLTFAENVENPVSVAEVWLNDVYDEALTNIGLPLTTDNLKDGPAAEPAGPLFAFSSMLEDSGDGSPGDEAETDDMLEVRMDPRRATMLFRGGRVYLETDDGLMVPEEAPGLSLSLDGGYQSRYYFLGLNQIENAVGSFDSDKTQMWYSGVTAAFRGLGAGVRYIRGPEKFQPISAFSEFETNYEEWVFDVNYSLKLFPRDLLNVTAGYEAIHFPEATFWNTGRQDHFYVTLRNASIPLLRPSVTYHHLAQADPLGNPGDPVGTENSFEPGVRHLEGDVMVFQLDGVLDLADLGLPLGLSYFGQIGLDDDYNTLNGDGFDSDWWQTGVSLPFYTLGGDFILTPNWYYNKRLNGSELGEHFWGVNARWDF